MLSNLSKLLFTGMIQEAKTPHGGILMFLTANELKGDATRDRCQFKEDNLNDTAY